MKEASMDWQNNGLLVNTRSSSLVESLVPRPVRMNGNKDISCPSQVRLDLSQ